MTLHMDKVYESEVVKGRYAFRFHSILYECTLNL